MLPLLLPDSPVVVLVARQGARRPGGRPARRAGPAPDHRHRRDRARPARRRCSPRPATTPPGNTDLSWTRLTPWRALLAAALDQYPAKIKGGSVAAERANPSADLLVAWLLRPPQGRRSSGPNSKGPGITGVRLVTGGGDIEISRPDGLLAEFSIPNAPNRPVALKRRELAELLAEELRRLDPDDVYAETVERLCRIADKNGIRVPRPPRLRPPRPNRRRWSPARTRRSRPQGQPAQPTGFRGSQGGVETAEGLGAKTAARKRAAKKSATRRTTRKSLMPSPTVLVHRTPEELAAVSAHG